MTFGQNNQAGIVGTITDSSGGTLPGVSVTATSPALQVARVSAVTDERRQCRIGSLPAGVCVVVYELSGFQTMRREEVRLPVNFVATIDIAMSIGSLQETVTVSGASPLVDVTNPATSIDLAKETLQTLPTTRDGLKAFMSVMPGVRPNLEVGASGMTSTVQFRSYGQAAQSWQMLDGVMFSAPNSGGANGQSRRHRRPRLDAHPDGREFGGVPRRGIMLDAVMKSGGNDFHGEFVGYLWIHRTRSKATTPMTSCGRRASPASRNSITCGMSAAAAGAHHPRQLVLQRPACVRFRSGTSSMRSTRTEPRRCR